MTEPQLPIDILPPPAPAVETSFSTIQPGTDYETPSSQESLPETSVAFCHPGSEAPFNILFSVPRVEKTPNGSWGVHYLTALTACQIVANNAFDGYISDQADGAPLTANPDSILLRSRYFFIVPDRPDYAVVPSFQEWQFPGSERIPRAWTDAVATTRAHSTGIDSRCVVSGRFATELAHLSPREERAWFLNNAMTVYDGHSASIPSDCPSNRILLDCSLHSVMDRRLWAFVPRHGRFAVQTISLPESMTYEMLGEFVHEYHGRHMRRINQTRFEYLLVRFAWAVLYQVKGFVLMARPKTLLARYRVWEDGVPRLKEEELLPEDIDALFGGGDTRSASSRKRSRTSSDQSRGSRRAYLNWAMASPACIRREPSPCEERGRKRTREEEDVVYGKRRRLRTSETDDPQSVPSLAATGSSAGASPSRASISPQPGPSLEGGQDKPKDDSENLGLQPELPTDPASDAWHL
ncbi:hypothetical protein diail_7145 [Diaporthe ilicicola]|nr:hypothetical protein diail_7145 [Diaporthe ilicicola]